jgi:CO/xanthine dehydrogenase Mo-binding subunit
MVEFDELYVVAEHKGHPDKVKDSSSVHNNALSVRDKAWQVAAHLLEAAEVDVVLREGRFQVLGVPERGLSWAEIAAAAQSVNLPNELQGGLESDTDFVPPGNLYPFGTRVAIVEVDADTGTVDIIRYLTMGVKGIGEAATSGSTPAIANAVIDALAHLGVRHVDIPLTAEKLWQAMQAA